MADNKYANAPYNFIEFPDKVVYRYDNIDDLPKHNVFRDDLKSGYIQYNLENLNPLFIGSGKGQIDDFFKSKDKDGKDIFVIPGSTMRGRVRSNAEVLSFSYPQFVEDRRLLYRGLAGHKSLRDEYGKKMKGDKLEEKVKVGYLFKDSDGKYKINPSKKIQYMLNGEKKEKEFFTIDEFKLKKHLNNDLGIITLMYKNEPKIVLEIEREISQINKEIRELYKKNNVSDKVKEEIGKKYSELTRDSRKYKDLFNYIKIENIKEMFKKKYKLWEKKKEEWEKFKKNKWNLNQGNLCYEARVKATIEEKNGGINKLEINSAENLGEKVIFYNSNYMTGKRKHYIIPQEFEGKSVEIEDKIINEYKNELENKSFIIQKGLEKEKEEIKDFYKVDDKGKIFFYKEINGKVISISRTPYLRLSYDYSTKEILNKNIKNHENNKESDISLIYDKNGNNLKYIIDYSEAIFGFTNKETEDKTISYKGRVNFTDLELKEDKGQKGKENIVLTNPKATSFQLYLKQDKNDLDNKGNINLKTYNNKKSKLRGQKFYWHQDIKKSQNTYNENMGKEINPLHENCVFQGKIYFENLSDDELGLLLLSLKYDDNTEDNIGMAKPYGYGKIYTKGIELVIEKKKESFQNFFDENLGSEKTIEKYKNNFKNMFLKKYQNKEEVNVEDYENLSIVSQYKVSKSSVENKKIEREYEYKKSKKIFYNVAEFDYMEIKKKLGEIKDGKKIEPNEFSARKPLKDINDYVKESKNE